MLIKIIRHIFLFFTFVKNKILFQWNRFYYYVLTSNSSYNIDIHNSVELKSSQKITFNEQTIIKKGTIINGRSTFDIGVNFGKETCIKEYCYIDSYNGRINFEGYSSIGQFCIIAGQGEINIGKYVMIGAHTYILSSNHIFKSLDLPYMLQGDSVKPVIIEDNVWIGGNVVILAGVRIGKNSVIGAGSIIQKDVPANTIYYTTREVGKFEIINHKSDNGVNFS